MTGCSRIKLGRRFGRARLESSAIRIRRPAWLCAAACVALLCGCSNSDSERGSAEGTVPGSGGQSGSPDAPQNAECGDGRIDISVGEECDKTDLGGKNCSSFGYASGDLACAAGCKLDKRGCHAAGRLALDCRLRARSIESVVTFTDELTAGRSI